MKIALAFCLLAVFLKSTSYANGSRDQVIFGSSTDSVLVKKFVEARQSSTWTGTYGGAAGRAIDGHTNGNFNARTCTHSSCRGETNPWWYVKLQSSKVISKVVIYNRQDCCASRLAGAVIGIGSSNFPPFTRNQRCGTISSDMTKVTRIEVVCNQPIIGQYVSVRLPGTNCLTLCEVQIYESVSVTPFITARQSSTYYEGGAAIRAIDGNIDTRYLYGRASCTHTARQRNPWWYADFGSLKTVSKVVIYNRGDCCADRLGDAQVRVGGTTVAPFTRNTQCGGTITQVMIRSNPVEIECHRPITGRYVSVYIPGNNKILSLCEVKVYSRQ